MKKLYFPLINKGAKFFTTSRRGAELIKYAANSFLVLKEMVVVIAPSLTICSSFLFMILMSARFRQTIKVPFLLVFRDSGD